MSGVPPLRLGHVAASVVDVLGPGRRAVVWVQGCSLHCPGCITPEMWSSQGGRLVDPCTLAEELMASPWLDGITVSGGEPTEQPAAVGELLARFKQAGKNTWVYSGYTLEELVAKADPMLDRLLSMTDVLVDGRYKIEAAAALRLRGSRNQRIIHLSNAIAPVPPAGENSARVELTLDDQGRLVIVGIPPAGFLPHLKRALEERGLSVRTDTPWGECHPRHHAAIAGGGGSVIAVEKG